MKRISAMILAFTLITLLCACGSTEPPQVTEDPQPINTPVPVVMEKSDGILTEEIYYNADGLRYMTVRYEYDGSGRVSKMQKLGVNEAPESYTAYEYGADGKLLKESYFNAVDAENFEPAGECVYEYDADGLCVKKDSVRDGYKSLYEYGYNADGQLITEKCHEDGELIYVLGYTYDENGNNTVLTRKSVMTETESVTGMEYDAEGHLIRVSTGEGSTVYEYNGHGDEVKMSLYDADGVLSYARITEHEYDEAGNIIRSSCSSEGTGLEVTVTEYVWTYAKG